MTIKTHTINGWGNTTPTPSKRLASVSDLHHHLTQTNTPFVPRGLGRSYGDSAVYDTHFDTTVLDRFIDFDPDKGCLTAQAGVSLASIVKTMVPKGWFLPVTPGTKFVTLGGAISSDVHGKNHHHDGCFSEFCTHITYMDAKGNIHTITPQDTLWKYICGGMGLYGVILSATVQLIPIQSPNIRQTTYKAENLNALLDLFETHKTAKYLVAWIDCLSQGQNLGRGFLVRGEHCTTPAPLHYTVKNVKTMPVYLPNWVFNTHLVKTFNTIHYNRIRCAEKSEIVPLDSYFYPLDFMHHWNRIYGTAGFIQYQCVVPKTQAGRDALHDMLRTISTSGQGSFLAVLKILGKANDNILSFPMHGYTLALDFKNTKNLHTLVSRLDAIVKPVGGRLYLAKDSKMTPQMMQNTYAHYDLAKQKRLDYNATQIKSKQSERLGL